MIDNHIYTLIEDIKNKDYCIASYYLQLPASEDPYQKAFTFAFGQTLGTWIPVPGITEAMRKKHMGKIVNILDLSPGDLSGSGEVDKKAYIFQLAYPITNFNAQFPMMITTLLGNDASTSTQAKLMDLQFPESFVDKFPGPAYGIPGLRKLCNVSDRPLLLNMIKPCTGFTPDIGAKIFYQTALGGVDFIKDDELLGNPDFCPLGERVKAYAKAAKNAAEITGKETIYIANITDSAARLLDNAKIAVENGAKMLMINFNAVGYSCLQMVREEVDVPILGHYAGSGPYYEGELSGMASPIALGKFPRLAGADAVMINTPYGGYPMKKSKYLRTAHELSLPLYSLASTMPCCGGGINPGLVPQLMEDLGTDIILAPGGAVQGHPMGPASGVKAMFQAIEASANNIPLAEAARNSEELQTAYKLWGEFLNIK